MGKHKKTRSQKQSTDGSSKGYSLADQILENKTARPSGRNKTRTYDEKDDFVEDKLTKKILDQARKQQEELQDEHGLSKESVKKTVRLGTSAGAGSDSEGNISDDDDELTKNNEQHYEQVEVNEEDEKSLQAFMSTDTPARRTLADIIMEKLTEKKTEIQSQMTDDTGVCVEQMDERVVKMYKQIRDVLSRYRSGKLPKAFKIIPALTNWEQILYLTEPDKWSAAAMYQASRIFVSNLNAKMAQRFFNLVLFPRIRDDIAEFKRLNFHLYMAVKKSMFKPAAFFKGILLPICESGTCTLREAVIIASIIAKTSIPVLHSSAALLKIAEMDYNGANSIFIRTLLDKKYALPYRVIDALVFHFLRFRTDKRELPVLWHQALLTFVQRYKEDVSSDQKSELLELLKSQPHKTITPEVRRELVNSKCRDDETGIPHPSVMEDDD